MSEELDNISKIPEDEYVSIKAGTIKRTVLERDRLRTELEKLGEAYEKMMDEAYEKLGEAYEKMMDEEDRLRQALEDWQNKNLDKMIEISSLRQALEAAQSDIKELNKIADLLNDDNDELLNKCLAYHEEIDQLRTELEKVQDEMKGWAKGAATAVKERDNLRQALEDADEWILAGLEEDKHAVVEFEQAHIVIDKALKGGE